METGTSICGAVRPDTGGAQVCGLPANHGNVHRARDGRAWRDGAPMPTGHAPLDGSAVRCICGKETDTERGMKAHLTAARKRAAQ